MIVQKMHLNFDMLTCLLVVLSTASLSSCKPTEGTNYGILIDAGSSGSKIKIYDWNTQLNTSSLPVIHVIKTTKFKPGISDLAFDAAKLGDYVDSMLKWAADIIPKSKHRQTPILILATAGMRFLEHRVSRAVMSKARTILSNPKRNPFATVEKEDVSVLSGEEEAAYAWIAANYLNGFFSQDHPNSHSVGILEMGGASTQIAFIPDGPVYDGEFQVMVANRRYSLYVHSYLDMGAGAIEDEIADWLYRWNVTSPTNNPCMLTGDNGTVILEGDINVNMEGSGDASLCREVLDLILAPDEGIRCQPKPCVIRSVYQPQLSNVTFYATQTFATVPFTLDSVRQDGSIDLNKLIRKIDHYCQLTLDEVVAKYPGTKKYASSDCVLGNYIPVLFQHYGFDLNTETIILKKKSQRIDWSLGAMLVKLSDKFASERGAVSMICPSKKTKRDEAIFEPSSGNNTEPL